MLMPHTQTTSVFNHSFILKAKNLKSKTKKVQFKVKSLYLRVILMKLKSKIFCQFSTTLYFLKFIYLSIYLVMCIYYLVLFYLFECVFQIVI